MALEIPKEGREAMAIINALPSALVEKLIASLKSSPPISNSGEMAAHIAETVSSIPTKQLTAVLDTLYTIYHVRELSGVSPSTFFEDLMEAIQNIPEREPALKDIPQLQSRLKKLLDIPTVNIISKAARLERDGERLYCESKILSDIRPVFASEPTIRPAGAVLVHTLKVSYHQGKDYREFHIALSSDDLEALSKVIHRAQAKEKTLRDLLKAAKLPNLGE